MNKISIEKVDVKETLICVYYKTEGLVSQYFLPELPCYKYECYTHNLSKVPESIAIIPFICDILPFLWMTDSELVVENLDKDFYNSIDKFKQGYINMYPMLAFKGKIEVENLVDNKIDGVRKACFFSGGLDAFSTLIAHIEERPILLFLRGNERILEKKEAWDKAVSLVDEVRLQYNLDYVYIRTNFKDIFNYRNLNNLVHSSKDDYFHGFQHGIGIISQAAPIAYILGIDLVYIASSHTKKDKVPCASDPSIDNYVQFSGCKISHDQYELTRQEKIKFISDYVDNSKHPITLRVCFNSKEGDNCCNCEKCYRTILGLVAEGVNPENYGFKNVNLHKIRKDIVFNIVLRSSVIPLWIDIQKRFVENRNNIIVNPDLEWIYQIDFNKVNKTLKKQLKILHRKIRSLISLYLK